MDMPVDSRNQSFITAAFESALCRPPTPAERELAVQFLAEQTEIIRNEAPAPTPDAHDQPDARARRDLIHALFSHTDFLTIH